MNTSDKSSIKSPTEQMKTSGDCALPLAPAGTNTTSQPPRPKTTGMPKTFNIFRSSTLVPQTKPQQPPKQIAPPSAKDPVSVAVPHSINPSSPSTLLQTKPQPQPELPNTPIAEDPVAIVATTDANISSSPITDPQAESQSPLEQPISPPSKDPIKMAAFNNADMFKKRLKLFIDALKDSYDRCDLEEFESDPKNLISWVGNVHSFLSQSNSLQARADDIERILSYSDK